MYFQNLFNETQLITWIIAGIAAGGFLIQAGIYLFVYTRAAGKDSGETSEQVNDPVSVIICAKNEEEHLRSFLPGILEQDYPEFEVIVVDDCSTDDTTMVLIELAAKYSHLRYTTITPDRKFTHGKKLALTVGIKAAKYETVLLTDADCYPASPLWIRGMMTGFGKENSMVLGYGKYEKRKGLLNILVRYETILTAIRYLGFARKGYPIMGVGRNIAYRKSVFFENRGFASHYQLASGDDDLFVNEVAGKTRIATVAWPESHTISLPRTSFQSWLAQKKRHISTGKRYRTGAKIRIAADWLSNLIFYAPAIYLAAATDWLYVAAGAWLLLTTVKASVLKVNMRRLQEKDLLLPSLFIEPLMPYMLFTIKLVQIFDTKPHKWS